MATSRLTSIAAIRQDFPYIHIALNSSDLSLIAEHSFLYNARTTRTSSLVQRWEWEWNFFFKRFAKPAFPSVFMRARCIGFTFSRRRLFVVRRFRNVAQSAVARQIDYVLAKGILRRARPRPPFLRPFTHATHVLIHVPGASYPARARRAFFFSIPFSLLGAPLQKLQCVSTKSTNHSIIKSVSALYGGRPGVAH